MAKIHKYEECNFLKESTIAVIGYGSQGRPQALNMKDSGLKVIIGLHESSKSQKQAKEDGFSVFSPGAATKRSDIVHFLAPDTLQPQIYKDQIESNLKPGSALVFSHGFNIHYEQITPPTDIDVYMVAPKGAGYAVRKSYLEGSGVASLVAIHQDATKKAKQRALAQAAAIGSSRSAILETTFAEETETDLFGEQAVLCGGIPHLIQAGFETLVEAGYDPQVAYFECLHEAKLIIDLLYEGGLAKMQSSISDTAEYGGYASGPRVINSEVKEKMQAILNDIQKQKGGKFAQAWIKETSEGYPRFKLMREKIQNHPIESVGKELRSILF